MNPRGRNVNLLKRNLEKLNEANSIGSKSYSHHVPKMPSDEEKSSCFWTLVVNYSSTPEACRCSSVAEVPVSPGLGLKSHGGGW